MLPPALGRGAPRMDAKKTVLQTATKNPTRANVGDLVANRAPRPSGWFYGINHHKNPLTREPGKLLPDCGYVSKPGLGAVRAARAAYFAARLLWGRSR